MCLQLISSPSPPWVYPPRGYFETSGGTFASQACEFHVYSSKCTYSLLEDGYPSICQGNSRFHLKKERSEGTNIYQEPAYVSDISLWVPYLIETSPWVLETLLHSLHNWGVRSLDRLIYLPSSTYWQTAQAGFEPRLILHQNLCCSTSTALQT